MNELLQKHGCANVFTVPEGLRELMSDITREVLRDQPQTIFDFIANYLSVLLITREHGILAVKILDDLCDCRPSVSDHLLQLGVERSEAEMLSQIIKEEIEEFEPVEGREKVKEMQIMKRILTKTALDEEMSAKVCQVARNAYRDYWYRKKLMEKNLKVQPEEPWEIAAERTLEIYKKTKPSFSELTRATQKIQAAYRGYHVRRNLLRHLKPELKKKTGPKVELPGPPLDVASSREIDLGPVIDIKVREYDVGVMFDEDIGEKLGLQYDPTKTITHIYDHDELYEEQSGPAESRTSKVGGLSKKSLMSRSEFTGPSKQSRVGESQQSQLPSQLEEKVKEMQIMKRILTKTALDEEMSAKVCQVARNAYRDYWYRKKLMEKNLKVQPEEPWEIAAERTLEIYKKTKPSFSELTRATQKIQAAYRGYHVRRNLLRHLKPELKKKTGPKVELPGPPLDVASSREIDLGPVIDIKVREYDVGVMFDEDIGEKLGLQYDPTKTITHIYDHDELYEEQSGPAESRTSKVGGLSKKSLMSRSEFTGPSKQSRVGESQQSQLPSQLEAVSSEMYPGPRESRLPSQTPEGPRQSRLASQMPPTADDDITMPKISFSQVPPKVIGLEEGDEDEAQEVAEQPGTEAVSEVDTAPEGEGTAGEEVVQEVPEDILDDHTEGDDGSVPTASVPSSAPDTANTTDIEDAGEEIVTTEEEG